MTEASSRSAEVSAAIRGLLDPLVVRLRGTAIAGLADRFVEAAAEAGLAGLVLATPRVVAALREAHAEVTTRQSAAEAEVEAAGSASELREALARVIVREVKDPRRRLGDLRALRRDLDVEALRERWAGEREALEVQAELALRVVARALPSLVNDATAAGPLRRAGLAEFLLTCTRWVPRFTLRLAAIEALQQLCDGLGAVDPDGEIAAAMRERATDMGEHPWVRAAAIVVWTGVVPGEAMRILEKALTHGNPEDRRGFLLRRLLVDELARRVRSPWAVDLVAAAVDDPSEHVRIGAARAAIAIAAHEPARARAIAAALADPWRETCPQVRAWALLTAAAIGDEVTLWIGLTDETAIVPLMIACEAAIPAAAAEAVRADRSVSGSIARAGRSMRASIRVSRSMRGSANRADHMGGEDAAERSMRAAVVRGEASEGAAAERSMRGVIVRGDRSHSGGDALSGEIGEAGSGDRSLRGAAGGGVDDGAGLSDRPASGGDVGGAAGSGDRSAGDVAGLGYRSLVRGGVGETVGLAYGSLIRGAGSGDRSGGAGEAAGLSDRSEDGGEARAAVSEVDLVLDEHDDGLIAALERLACDDARSAAVHEAAAAALEAVDRLADPRRAGWTAAIGEALVRVAPGDAAVVPLRRDGAAPPDRRMLGRILAELTRADWGVDADVRGDRLILRRGDRWRTRLWRVLFELRRPQPGKRAAHPHGRGRVTTGTLRAPSGRLHEVTATGVPGERVHIDREGGWGRHLPRVDDVLGLPLLGARPVEIVSSHGVCTLAWRGGLLSRLAMRLRVSLRYAWLAELRAASLAADEDALRGRYVATLRAGFGVLVKFAAHPRPGAGDLAGGTGRELPRQLRSLFVGEATRPPPLARPEAAGLLLAPELLEWVAAHGPYFVSVSANSQQALALFLLGLAAVVLTGAYVRRRQVARARAAIPLVIGGWGTRGKSGTERLKLGLLHGLGYKVFAKTTGCEAMFLHAAPLGPPLEIFTFRPYGKATIWEQRTLLRLAAELHADVFLWECMALTPAYVEVLQRHWMRDDMATITNAYPDHEDIQGPAGIDVAEVIARFVPDRSRVVTSEINFLPVLRAAADRVHSALTAVDERAGDLLAPDLLALLPYDEHPRNVALVAKMAEELGLDPMLAVVTMAEHVVPDLGVLQRFGPARVRGRAVEFINGCSANERTGFLSNWRRTGCEHYDLAREPDRYLITAVNNREDRVARSQVFAKVLVEDVAVDRHVLLGTNTRGLVGYVRAALAEFLAAQVVVTADDMSAGTGLAAGRLSRLLARLRIPPVSALAGQLEIFARGAGKALRAADRAEAERRVNAWVAAGGVSVRLGEVLGEAEKMFAAWAGEAVANAEAAVYEPPEVDVPAQDEEVVRAWVRQVARAAIAVRLHARLDACMGAGPGAIDEFHGELRGAYEALFMELIDVIEDPGNTGDQVVLRCALAVPPGVRVTVMGTQNIKGTGLDFVYRWLALAAAMRDLQALTSRDAGLRAAAWMRLASPDDPGLMDAGLVAARLAAWAPAEEEEAMHARALASAQARHAAKRAGLTQGKTGGGRGAAVLQWLEGWIDFVDAVVRQRRAGRVMRDLADRRISHARAALVMRELDARAKGGWLARRFRAR